MLCSKLKCNLWSYKTFIVQATGCHLLHVVSVFVSFTFIYFVIFLPGTQQQLARFEPSVSWKVVEWSTTVLASISSNFGKKRMAKSAKSPENSSKLFVAYSRNFVRISYKNILWNGFFVICAKKAALRTKKPRVNCWWNWQLGSIL